MHKVIKLATYKEEPPMDWPTIISEILCMEEISEKQLSASLHTPITASALNRLKKGYTKMPLFSLGHELIKRHKKLKRQRYSSMRKPIFN